MLDQRYSLECDCKAKQHDSQQTPKVQDYQLHTYSSAKKHEPERFGPCTRWFELTTQLGNFDDKHQLQKMTESGTCSCNLQQKVWH